MNQSLAIRQVIGDIAGLCATLFNMGHIHWQNKEQKEAMQKWLTVYKIAKNTNLAQALDALKNLAEKIGLKNGLDGLKELTLEDI